MPSSTSNEKRTAVRGLGEVALRVNNLDATQKFYEEVIGLSLMTRVPNCAFFKDCGGPRRSYPSARLVRPLKYPRLSSNRCGNFYH